MLAFALLLVFGVLLFAVICAYLMYRAGRAIGRGVESTFSSSTYQPSYREESHSTTYVPVPYLPPSTSSWEPSYTPSYSNNDDSSSSSSSDSSYSSGSSNDSSYSSSDSSSSSDSGFGGGDSGGGGGSNDW